MNVWQIDFARFTDVQKETIYSDSSSKFWGGVYPYNYEKPMNNRSIAQGVAYTPEAFRFLKARNKKLKLINVSERALATVVEFREYTIHVLDWCALIEGVATANQHFYGSSKMYCRVEIALNSPFILNKENVLNHALFEVASIAAIEAGRKVRDVDHEGLVQPQPLTDLFQAMDLSTEELIKQAIVNHPEPKLSFSHAPQT